MKQKHQRLLSLFLALMMLMTVCPITAFAANADAAGSALHRITAADQLTTGQYVMVVETGYAPGALDSGWLPAVQAVADVSAGLPEQLETFDPTAVWTLTVTDQTVTLADASGNTVAPKPDSKGKPLNGIIHDACDWNVAFNADTRTFQFTTANHTLASNASTTGNYPGNHRFRAYKNTTVNGSYASEYKTAFALYKLDGEVPPQPPTPPTPPAEGVVSIAEALAGSNHTPFKVKGVVTFVDNYHKDADTTNNKPEVNRANVYIQDATGAIDLYFPNSTVTLKQGDVVIATGKRGAYNDIPQLSDAAFELSTGEKLEPKPATVQKILAGETPKCSYVKLEGVVVDHLDDYGNLFLKDADGTESIQVYKPVTDSSLTIAAGDVLNVSAVVSTHKDKSGTIHTQLRNSAASEIAKQGESKPDPDPVVPGSVLTIAEAQKAEHNGQTVTVKGAIHYIHKYKMWVQDSTGWMYLNVQASNNTFSSSLKLGSTVLITGTINNGKIAFADTEAAKAGVQAVSNPDEQLTLTAQPKQVEDITAADTGMYVELKDLKVTKIDQIGQYKVPMVTLSDKEGHTIQWYNPKTRPHEIGLNDEITVLHATVDNHRGNIQLMNCDGSETQFVEKPLDGTPAEGDQVVIYCDNSNGTGKIVGVLGTQKGESVKSPAILNAEGVLDQTSKKVAAGNGAHIFEVQKKDGFYRFYNEADGYLCSKDAGKNLFYCKTPGTGENLGQSVKCSYWTLEASPLEGGFMLRNEEARFVPSSGGSGYAQYLQQFGDGYSTYSSKTMKTDPAEIPVYTFYFYPASNKADEIVHGIVNRPVVVLGEPGTAYVTKEYKLAFTVDAPFGYKDSTVTLNGETYTPQLVEGEYVVTVPAEKVTGTELVFQIVCHDMQNREFSAEVKVPVTDVPLFGDPKPTPNSAVTSGTTPEISIPVTNAGENPTVKMTVNDTAVEAKFENGKVVYTPAAALADGIVTVSVTVTRADDQAENTYTWKFSMGEPMEQLYFGQLHAHTQYSDGAGSLESALNYVKNIPSRDNVDFVSFTDHSNYFDGSKMGGSVLKEDALYHMTAENGATKQITDNWNSYKKAIADFNAESNGRVTLAGFEMTWSGGPGHINTFNTPGIVSRNNKTLNDKTADAGMKAYYALLNKDAQAAEAGATNWDGSAYDGKSISQFNHPGKTFGTFKDFAYWDPITDQRMCTVEVGNGEGKIHMGGYYPSYSEYTKALDKGWHVAPTNNQDNHKGRWGNANDARDVILTDNFSEQGIYDALRARKVYATEDKNLQMFYNVNGQPMGSILKEIPAELNIEVELHDPDHSDSIAKVELVVNSGRVAYTWDKAAAASGKLTCTLKPEYSYYYVRVTEADGDLAVSAPVWVGDVLKLGISSVECDTAMPVTGEDLNIKTTVFNSETQPATVTKVTYADANGKVLFTDDAPKTVNSASELVISQPYTFDAAMLYTVKVTVDMTQGGKSYSYSMDLELDVEDANGLVYIGFDAAHYNEYVSGNYKDSMGNFANLASKYAVRTVYLDTSDALISACSNPKYKMLILTAPSRRLADAQKDPRSYTQAELDALKAFSNAGGTIVLAGWSDHYEDFPDALPKDFKHMSEAQNEVLAALGSSLRVNDDATYDDVYSKKDGCDPWRLYFNTYNMEHPLAEGVIYDKDHPYDDLYTERFSHYGGASIYAVGPDGKPAATLPATVSPLVFGHETTYSKDTDKDNKGVVGGQKYHSPKDDDRLLILATEQLPGKGQIIVSGAAFMSNFEVQMQMDNNAQKNFSNYRICENLLKGLNQKSVDTIAAVQAEKNEGIKFTIEGVVTSNASGHDANTAFFDCIYLQDATAGINAFPVAGNFKIGDKVRITGHTSSYNGERQIAVKQIEKIGEAAAPAPKEVTAAQINDGSVLGSLITLKGTVTSFSKDNGLIQTIMVKDANGQEARVFIDGYITKDQDVQNLKEGCNITVTGLASYDNSFAGPAPRIRIRNRADVVCSDAPINPDVPVNPNHPVTPVKPVTPQSSGLPFVDVPKGAWYYDSVEKLYNQGLVNGMTATTFAPDATTTRGQVVTMLWRMAGQPVVNYRMTYQDVPADAYYAEAVRWASSTGVVTGYNDQTFGPNDLITREQLVSILYRHAKKMGYDVSATAKLTGFLDADQISDWARDAMTWACGVGLITGVGEGRLMPQGQATRAQIVTILDRFLGLR